MVYPYNSDIESCLSDPSDPDFQRLVRDDLERAISESKLCIEESLLKPLLVQTVLGHAAEGHREFHGKAKYPFASMTDIIAAAGMDVKKTKETRQDLVDQFFEWLELAKQDKTDSFTLNGRPLMGIEFLKEDDFKIIPEYALKGATLAGFMDNFEWRTRTLKKYNYETIDGEKLRIGGGKTYLVDPNKLKMEWKLLGAEAWSKAEITAEMIDGWKKEGVFTYSGNPDAEVVYVRRKKGWGTSDDAAFIIIGEMHKKHGIQAARSAMLGAFLVDAIDTYDKCLLRPVEGGYDEKVGKDLREAIPDIVSDDDITSLIYHCAKGNGEYIVSSSHKRLTQVITGVDPKMPMILHHLKFMETGTSARFRVGFERQPSPMFYGEVNRRLSHYKVQK